MLNHIMVRPMKKYANPVEGLPPYGEVGILTVMLQNDHKQCYVFYQSIVSPRGGPGDIWDKIHEAALSIGVYLKADLSKELVMPNSGSELSGEREEAKDQNWHFIELDESLITLGEFLADRFKAMVI